MDALRKIIVRIAFLMDPDTKAELLEEVYKMLDALKAAQQPAATSAPDSAEIDALRARISELEKINDESDHIIEAIHAEKTAFETKIPELEAANAAKDVEIAELKAANAAQTAKIAELEAANAAQTAKLSELTDAVTAALAAKTATPAAKAPEPPTAPEPATTGGTKASVPAAAAAVEPAPEGMLPTKLSAKKPAPGSWADRAATAAAAPTDEFIEEQRKQTPIEDCFQQYLRRHKTNRVIRDMAQAFIDITNDQQKYVVMSKHTRTLFYGKPHFFDRHTMVATADAEQLFRSITSSESEETQKARKAFATFVASRACP